MAADDLLLEAGTRLLHIGPHKTGTTAAADRLVRDVPARNLAGVLVSRGGQRIRRTLRPPG